MGLVKTRRLAAMQKQQRAKAGMKPPTQRYSRMGKRSRKDKKEFIRSLALLLALLAGSASARMVVVPPQPMSPYADTEVSTNIPFSVSSEHAREIEMRFALDGCMSNCVQVAFGKDADGDGVLGADEAETLYGWRNGRYFAESVADGLRVEEADSGNMHSRVFAINLRLKKGEGLRYFTATNDMGVAIFTNLNATAQNWLYKPDWNMMRVTRRGPGVPAEWFSCDLSSHFFYIKLR